MNIKWWHQNLPIIEFWYLWDTYIHRLPEDFAEKRNLIMKENLAALVKNLKCFNDIVFSSAIKHITEEKVMRNIQNTRSKMI